MTLIVKLRYMAPECLARQPYNLTADVYTFAIILHETLSIQIPYAFIRRAHQLITHIVEEKCRPTIVESWPVSIKNMLESSFDDAELRPVSSFTFLVVAVKSFIVLA